MSPHSFKACPTPILFRATAFNSKVWIGKPEPKTRIHTKQIETSNSEPTSIKKTAPQAVIAEQAEEKKDERDPLIRTSARVCMSTQKER